MTWTSDDPGWRDKQRAEQAKCRTCKHWLQSDDVTQTAVCQRLLEEHGSYGERLFSISLLEKEPYLREVDEIWTSSEFGCVLHEPKPCPL